MKFRLWWVTDEWWGFWACCCEFVWFWCNVAFEGIENLRVMRFWGWWLMRIFKILMFRRILTLIVNFITAYLDVLYDFVDMRPWKVFTTLSHNVRENVYKVPLILSALNKISFTFQIDEEGVRSLPAITPAHIIT